jgi:hypothetical protein
MICFKRPKAVPRPWLNLDAASWPHEGQVETEAQEFCARAGFTSFLDNTENFF